jgi:hypothetical protein
MKTKQEIKDKREVLGKLESSTFIADSKSELPKYADGDVIPPDHVKAMLPVPFFKVFNTNKEGTYVIRMDKKAAQPKFTPNTELMDARAKAADTFWEQKDLILKTFPEIADDWAQAEKKISKKGCKSCTRNAQKNRIVRRMELSFRENKRDVEPLREVLGTNFLNKLRNFGKTPRSLKKIIQGPRTTCLDCTRKHIAQAIVLLGEAQMGYPEHRWLAVGHLAEATEESMGDYPVLAADLRMERLAVMDNAEYKPNLMVFFDEIDKLEEAENTPKKGLK